jgi:hypothetical protein
MQHTAKRFYGGLLATGASVFVGATLLGTPAAVAYGPTPSSGSVPAIVTTTTAAPTTTTVKSSALAFTGADVAMSTAAGAVAIGLGGMLVLGARNRRRQHNPVD